MLKRISFFVLVVVCISASAQQRGLNWAADGTSYYQIKAGSIVRTDPKTETDVTVVSKEQLTPAGGSALRVQSFDYSADKSKILLFTNTAKVWRYRTRGDYWVYNVATQKLTQLGKDVPAQTMMFAKFSPDGKQVAYVSASNLYSEDLSNNVVRKLTNDGTRKMINGTFDWVYEEEFGMRDGFRWSPDSRNIAFWKIDANKIRDYYMVNNTDSPYSRVIPVEYPKVGQPPSPAYIYVVALNGGVSRKMNIDGDPQQHYLTRMEWSGPGELMVQQLDRKQQESKLMYINTATGNSSVFWAESDDAWVDLNTEAFTGEPGGWKWVNEGKDFLWTSEKDGWRHIYRISRDGKTTTLLTKGNYDIGEVRAVDETNNWIYFSASPDNATQQYLYRCRINNPKDEAEPLSGTAFKGVHKYDISPNARYAMHSFSNYNTPPVREWVSFPDNRALTSKTIAASAKPNPSMNIEYTQVTTEDNVVLDAWIHKPDNFDANKKYPVVLYVYGEPASSTVMDEYGNHSNFLYGGEMAADGYVQVGIDNRGTPSLKSAKWRKSIYRKNGSINIRDMALGFKKLSERSYFDKTRLAVWGWSGGGSSTLNLMFNYPDLFQTGIAIAAVTNLLNYDNIYTERYMGLPQENPEDYTKGSPITNAKNLKGNLLFIHGTGDDNVHYDNAEMLINELVKHGKQFRFMAYPNRTHSINEGQGTGAHLSKLYTDYLREHCAPGGK